MKLEEKHLTDLSKRYNINVSGQAIGLPIIFLPGVLHGQSYIQSKCNDSRISGNRTRIYSYEGRIFYGRVRKDSGQICVQSCTSGAFVQADRDR